MTAVDEAIKEFVKDRVGGVIVNYGSGEICYQDSRIELSEKGRESWERRRPLLDERRTWEFTDADIGKYYRVETASITVEDTIYQCHLFTDVSDYATLFQDISDYSRRISDMSDFQKSILSKLSQEYDSFLPELTEFCGATDAILYMEQDGAGYIRKSTFGTRLNRMNVDQTDTLENIFSVERFDFSDGYYCFLCEKTEDQKYSLFLRRGPFFNEEYFRDASVYNVIRLYIENGILREKILYESEHDALTGLYNKGKFLSMKDMNFHHPDSIAIFNFDVNNLKQVNDSLGHEAGDCMIRNAALTIHSIEQDNVLAFRMGGDEFLAIALNITEEETEEIYSRWQKSLDKINSEKEDAPITIASGVEYAQLPFSLDSLMEKADEKMYQNKIEMKKKLGLPDR
ncbi:MAG: GGDEF domain-containing protein [Lachnospiraceae bacterium]|nr:GGDEF domain-containing protein [Lachnospiraceae bacterium]